MRAIRTVLFLALYAPLVAFSQGRSLPDFSDLVEKEGPAVVNISTTSERRAGVGQVPGIDENDPFYEFFRRFVPRQPPGPGQQPPGPGQQPPGPGPQLPGPGFSPREFESRSLGSGFIVSADGYVLTNAHVVNNADEITVKLNDKREFRARVIGADARTDLAVLKIDATGLPTVRFGDPNKLRVGEWVLAIGSPFGFDNTVTAGIVSAKGRSLPQENFVPFLQTDVAINPGNSGGPLFNMRGEVVGINSQIYSRTGGFMGLSFAIPIDVAMDIQNQLRTSGRVHRGRIGVVIQEVSREIAESFGLQKPAGALVNAVEKGGPAEKGGLEVGDIITKFDGKAVGSSSDLPRMVGGTKPGSNVGVELWRKGGARQINVVVGELPEDRVASRVPTRNKPAEQPTANRLGFAVQDLSAEQRRDLKLGHGVVVQDVRPTVRADVRPGDVVLAVSSRGQTTELQSADQFNKLLAQIERNATITLQVRRGESNLFVTIRGEVPRG